ncbi:hypothetical protein Taro_005378, partial [Colocasia esculenta]|nr:hypothetical protein [Colocasia esculenta]
KRNEQEYPWQCSNLRGHTTVGTFQRGEDEPLLHLRVLQHHLRQLRVAPSQPPRLRPAPPPVLPLYPAHFLRRKPLGPPRNPLQVPLHAPVLQSRRQRHPGLRRHQPLPQDRRPGELRVDVLQDRLRGPRHGLAGVLEEGALPGGEELDGGRLVEERDADRGRGGGARWTVEPHGGLLGRGRRGRRLGGAHIGVEPRRGLPGLGSAVSHDRPGLRFSYIYSSEKREDSSTEGRRRGRVSMYEAISAKTFSGFCAQLKNSGQNNQFYASQVLLQRDHALTARSYAKEAAPSDLPPLKGDEMLKNIFLDVKKKFEVALGVLRKEKITIDPDDPAAVSQYAKVMKTAREKAGLFSESERIKYTIEERTQGISDARTYLLTLKEIRVRRGLNDELGVETMMMDALEKVEKEIKKPLLRSDKKGMALLLAEFDKINKKLGIRKEDLPKFEEELELKIAKEQLQELKKDAVEAMETQLKREEFKDEQMVDAKSLDIRNFI